MNRLLLALWLCLFAAGMPPSARAQGETVSQVLAHVRAAVNPRVSPANSSLTLRGNACVSGVRETYRLVFAPAGQFRETLRGDLGQITGFDGRAAWQVDAMQMPRGLEMQNRDVALLVVSVLTGRWLSAADPFSVTVPPHQDDPASAALTLQSGLLPATLIVNRATWLPRALTYTTTDGPQRWEMSDYRTEQGQMLAHRWTHAAGSVTDLYTIQTVKPQRLAASDYAPVTKQPQDTWFDPHVSPQTPLLRVKSGHLLVRPRIDGKDVGWFILDTGASVMVLDPQAVLALHLPTFGRQTSSGAGALVQTSFCRGRTFALGPLTLKSPLYAQYDLRAASKAFHVPVAGVCGYDLFSRTVLEIDQSQQHLALYDPRRYHLAAGRWEPLFLDDGVACVRCRFEGDRAGIFSLDTGANGTVDFLAPAVARLGLLKGRPTTAAEGHGVGGSFGKRQGQMQWFEIGGHRFLNPSVGFSLAEAGDLSGLYEIGNVGEKFLDPFTLVFDYPHRRMAFLQKKP